MFIQKRITNKKEFLEAVKEDCDLLKYASEYLKNDKDVVLEAVKQNCSSLIYASDELRNDKDVVLEAVNEDGCSIQYVSDEIYSLFLNCKSVDEIINVLESEIKKEKLEKIINIGINNKKVRI